MPQVPPQFRLYLLGSFHLERDSQTIRLPTRKVESLFAYLVLFPEAHTREKLASLFWGDSTDEQARHSLRTALAAIRKELGEDVLIADRETVQLSPDVPMWVDACEFEQMANRRSQMADVSVAVRDMLSAISHYAADLLPDFFDDWIIRERERLRLLYLDALLQLAQHYRSASDYARAIEIAQKVLAADRANEKAYQHLMFCYAAMGERITALKQYDECKRILRDELNVEPSSETVALRDQIMQELTGTKSQAAALTNLPIPLTSFVGRKQELTELKEPLSNTRLLTLTGSGGCGKTRLAIQVGREFADAHRFRQGVWWVDLAVLSDPTLVPQTVAAVFDLRESSNVPIINLLSNYLREKELLLMLDNCEHLVDACARLAETLLAACSKLQILATSREVLGITGEVVWRVPSLAVPDAEHLPPLDQLAQYDAIQLFVQRAAAIVPNWKLNGNARGVARICARLDGIPLAIELAAARLKALSAEQIAARLDDRFQLLTGGSRTALPRQETLRGAMDWSYELLSDAERALLRRLSVFAGGWTLEAAEAVCSGNGIEQNQVLDLLTHLVDKSLVVVEAQADESRYRMLETIRQYAHEKLVELGEWQPMQERHLDFFLKLAEAVGPKLKGAEAKKWMDRLETEYANLRAAGEQAIASDAELALRLAWSLFEFWTWRSHLIEGREWLTRLLAQTEVWGATARRARALNAAGRLDLMLRNVTSARSLFEQSLTIARKLEEEGEIAYALWGLGRSYHFLGDSHTARSLLEESLAIYRAMGDQWNVAQSLWALGDPVGEQGDLALAQALHEESLAMFRALGDDYFSVVPLTSLGELARDRGDYDRAAAYHAECVEIDKRVVNSSHLALALVNLGLTVLQQGDHRRAAGLLVEDLDWLRRRGSQALFTIWLVGMAGVIEATGKPAQAARLLGSVEALLESLGMSGIIDSTDRKVYGDILGAVRRDLDKETFDQAWAEGRTMNLERAIEYALENVKSI